MMYYYDSDQLINPEQEEEEEWDREAYLDPKWELQQKKTFTAWCNSHLRKMNMQIKNIETDFCNGINLLHLLQALAGDSVPKADKGSMRFHQMANVNKGLSYIEGKGVQLINIGGEEIVDGNVKMTLGLIWTIILRFAIQDITVEEMSAKEGLLLWCKRKTAPYKNTNVQNFHFSWKDGLAFCALIHRHRPELIDYGKLSRENPIDNLNYAFDVAEKYLDIPKMLDADDMVNSIKPDERSVMAYVSSYYHAFAGAQKAETAANRICKVLEINQENEKLMNAYENLASDLLKWINSKLPFLKDKEKEKTIPGLKSKLNTFREYRGREKPPKLEQKGELEMTFNTLQTRLRLSNRPAYLPTEGHMISDIQAAWKELDKNEIGFEEWLVAEIQRLERLDQLVQKFNLKCDTHELWVKDKNEVCKPRDFKTISLCELKNLMKQLESFETDLGAHQGRVERIVAIAEELNTLNYDHINMINDRTQHIANQWDGVGEATANCRKILMETIKAKEQLDSLHVDFSRRIVPFYNWLEQAEEDLQDILIINRLQEISNLIAGHETFKNALPKAERELTDILRISANIQSVVESTGLPTIEMQNPYTTITLRDVQEKWKTMNILIPQRDASLQSELVRQQRIDNLRRQFAQSANQIGPWLEKENDILNTLVSQSKLHLEAQRSQFIKIEEDVVNCRPRVDELESINKIMQEAEAFDNSYSSYTIETIRVGWEQLLTNVRKAINEADNQILTRDTKGISDTQMAEFRKCFNHFDRTRTRKLDVNDFKACLVSLGFRLMNDGKVDNVNMRQIMHVVDPNQSGYVTFDAFINFVTKENGDQDSVEQLAKSFSILADDKPYITKDILLRELPPNQAQYCIERMSTYQGENNIPDALDYTSFANRLYGESDL